MKRVKVITGLKIEEHMFYDDTEYITFVRNDLLPVYAGGEKPALIEHKAEEYIVPILHFHFSNKPDLYIAYFKEVEEFLQTPYSMLKTENDSIKARANMYAADYFRVSDWLGAAQKERDAYKNATIWQRIKFLFGVHPT